MTDETSPQDESIEQPVENEPAGEETTDNVQQDSSTPRGPRVFGRFAVWIVVMPFIFYLTGTMVGPYIETLRDHLIRGTLDDYHHGDESTLPQEEEIPLSELEKEIDPNERFLFGLLPLNRDAYPYTYTFTIAGTTLLMLMFGWGYFKAPFKISFLSIVVGVVGVVAWIALAELDKNFLGISDLVSSGRTAFNPFETLKGDPTWMWQFLAIRFFGLVIVVPIIEEFFVRGFLMRYVEDPDWDELPLGKAKNWVWFVPTIYGLVAHLTEPLAAIVWFSMVSWMYKRTGSIWDCVVAHMVTNLLLGLYVCYCGAWYLW
ncbi:MAG: CAAX prenyl protease-related protein [Planctomycetaceae bacterium]|nr:CAAX prenyl protease-related protein [Planctomycetaceae bacterium]